MSSVGSRLTDIQWPWAEMEEAGALIGQRDRSRMAIFRNGYEEGLPLLPNVLLLEP